MASSERTARKPTFTAGRIGLTALLILLLGLFFTFRSGPIPRATTAADAKFSVPQLADLKREPPPSIPAPPAMQLSADRLSMESKTASEKVPLSAYNGVARADTLAPGIDAAFALVRDEVRYESYPGVLRGAMGAYSAKAANTFDRSLLLAGLLKRKGIRTRFVTGHLDAAMAEVLFARMFDAGPRGFSLAPGSGGGPAAVHFRERLWARARRDYRAVRLALPERLSLTPGPSHDAVLREIENHAWIQAFWNGRWVDLDSAFGDAEPGRAYCAVERTLAELPPELHQRVTMRVVIDRLKSGAVRSETVLDVPLPADQLVDHQIFFTHVRGGLQGMAGTMSRVLGAGEQAAWTPMLLVDGDPKTGRPIVFESIAGSGGFADFFGSNAPAAQDEFVAEWLEFEVVLPDGRRDVTRRALVDRGGPAWRARPPDAHALAPLPRTKDGLIAPRALHNIWITSGGHDLGNYLAAVHELSAARREAEASPASNAKPSFEAAVWPYLLQNAAFVITSDAIVVPAVNDLPSVRLYADSPRIAIFSVGPGAKPDTVESMVDLRRDALRAVVRDDASKAAAVDRKIWFGILEGALEHEFIQGRAGDASGQAEVASTSSVAGAAALVVLGPADQARVGEVVPAAAAATLIRNALNAGAMVVVPRAQGGQERGWWEIGSAADTRPVLGPDLNMAFKVTPKYLNPKGPAPGALPKMGGPFRPGPPGGGAAGSHMGTYITILAYTALAVADFASIGWAIYELVECFQ